MSDATAYDDGYWDGWTLADLLQHAERCRRLAHSDGLWRGAWWKELQDVNLEIQTRTEDES